MLTPPPRLPGFTVIEPTVHRDERGFFVESYRQEVLAEAGLVTEWVQDNHARSSRGVLRGMHFSVDPGQVKLVRCARGRVLDVAVDIREDSPTFGRWVGITLSAENFRQFYVPPGFAHGFCVTTEVAQVEYKCTDLYDPEGEGGIAWNDPELAIPWPVEAPILSRRDETHPTLRQKYRRGPTGPGIVLD